MLKLNLKTFKLAPIIIEVAVLYIHNLLPDNIVRREISSERI